MDEAELNEVYEALLALLRESDLGWVADQAADEVSFGRVVVTPAARRGQKTGSRSFDGEPRESLDLSSAQAVEKGAAISAVPFRAFERVQLLIRALRRVLVDADALQLELSRFLASELESGQIRGRGVVLSAAEGSEDRTPLARLDYTTPAPRQRLLGAVDELERRIAEER